MDKARVRFGASRKVGTATVPGGAGSGRSAGDEGGRIRKKVGVVVEPGVGPSVIAAPPHPPRTTPGPRPPMKRVARDEC